MKWVITIMIFLLLRLACSGQQGGGTPSDTLPKYWGNFAFTAGVWAPTSRLKVLGTHPSLGMQGGIRTEKDELDANLSVRFVRTPHDYRVLKDDSLYSRHGFLGGYIGLDYTHFFYQETHFQLGLMAGAGYDGFTIGNGSDDDNYYLRPLDIGSFNFNLGLRLSYSFKPSLYIGLLPRYNFIHYDNKGGTSLVGNAFSIDFVIGGNFFL